MEDIPKGLGESSDSPTSATDRRDVPEKRTHYTRDVVARVGEDRYERQINLERTLVANFQATFEREMQTAIAEGREGYTVGGQAALRKCLVPLARAIGHFQTSEDFNLLDADALRAAEAGNEIKARRGKKPGRNYRHLIEDIHPMDVAGIALRCCLQAPPIRDKEWQPLSQHVIARRIAEAMEEAAKVAKLNESDADLRHTIERQMKAKSQDAKGMRVVFDHALRNELGGWEDWTYAEKMECGSALMYAVMLHTGLVTFEDYTFTDRTGSLKQARSVVRSAELDEIMQDANARAMLMTPQMRPFLAPPRPWVSPTDGAFWSNEIRETKLVRKAGKRHLHLLRQTNMGTVYRAVNAAQDTAWRVNPKVWEVFKWAWESGDTLGILPERYDRQHEPWPDHELTEQEHADLMHSRHMVHQFNRENGGQRAAYEAAYSICAGADQAGIPAYADEEMFFYSYTLDFRGRMYPMQSGITPQGQDVEKGLLQFAEGVPLSGDGERWLFIHGANCFGHDKVSFDERVEWVQNNQAKIVQCAQDPKSYRWWVEADEPWQFLAFCFEVLDYMQANIDGVEFITHLPCAVDGTCNGLQHLSAMMRDTDGAREVNLCNLDTRMDIYQAVADQAMAMLRAEVQSGGEKARLASDLLEAGITRKITKRPVMVIPYGGTMRAVLQYTQKDIEERLPDRLKEPVKEKGQTRLTEKQRELKTYRKELFGYLAKIVWDAMGTSLGPARQCMDWMQDVAKLYNEAGADVSWRSPTGFVALHQYRKLRMKKLFIPVDGRKPIQTKFGMHTGDVDKNRQRNAVAPNIIHSFDAAHMMMTIDSCREAGIEDFALVHDSFGTHASNISALQYYLRESFRQIYSHDNLKLLERQFVVELFEHGNTFLPDVPSPPKLGDWNVEEISDADYFFG